MNQGAAEPPSFVRLGPAQPETPVVLAVPHAGRFYPDRLLAGSRLPRAVLEQLADKDVDKLIWAALQAGARAVVATMARAWLDLNRDPREVDPGMVSPPPRRDSLLESGRVRAGLGLIPRRIAGHGEIPASPITADDLAERIARHHQPYHAALGAMLADARARFGQAILLDIHSMPSLEGKQAAELVIGDRHGRSAATAPMGIVMAAARRGWRVSRNAPYAGGYTLDRHGRPGRGSHAIQIEFDRALYLTPDGGLDGAGADRLGRWLADLVIELAGGVALPRAAE